MQFWSGGLFGRVRWLCSGTHMYATYDKIPIAAVKSIPGLILFFIPLWYSGNNLPNPGTSKFSTKQRVANGMGKMGIAALTAEFLTINFGSMAVFTILKEDKTKYWFNICYLLTLPAKVI